MPSSRQVRLKSRPVGIPQPEHFEIVEAPIPEPKPGEFVVRNHFLSVDPAMRGWVNEAPSYVRPVGVGEVMRAYTAGEVVTSKHPRYKEGDKVMGQLGWQDHAVSDGRQIWRKVTETDLPLSLALGVMGLNGITAYFGLLDVGQPRPGDVVVVSTAAGAVGSAVGQIAKIVGCRTVGIAGGPEKAQLCATVFGYDAAINYKAHKDSDSLAAAVGAACPKGLNVYFDNTSGWITDAVLPHMAIAARVAVCGTASIANWDPLPVGPMIERWFLIRRARLQGFLASDFAHRYDEALARLAQWVREGRLRYKEDILDGMEAAPGAIAGLYRGENLGKRLIRLV